MQKILVLDQNYPHENNLYGDVFVHTRVKEYRKYADVKVLSFFCKGVDFVYEGVSVFHAPELSDIQRFCEEYNPDCIFIHFYHRDLLPFIQSVKVSVIIWVHGYEALGWYRRLFNLNFFGLIRHLPRIIFENFKQMAGFRKLIRFSNKNNRVHFVFVSDWMRKIAQADSLIKVRNFSIICNPINHQLFSFNSKKPEDRKSILLIRPFTSSKYANDVAVKAIIELSKRDFFKDLNFSIYGKGIFFKKITEPLLPFANVKLTEAFLSNSEIPVIHRNFGILLSPTRQDAQGVTMCEAMSSGLVPISTNCTAIPEFIQDKKTGLLTNSPKEIADAIEYLYYHDDEFRQLSENASRFIHDKCDIEKIASLELSLINRQFDARNS